MSNDPAKQQVIFDYGPLSGPTAFTEPLLTIRANAPNEVPAAFAEMEKAKAEGHWLAGYASYELGYAFSPEPANLMPDNRKQPLLCFGVFEAPHLAQFSPVQDATRLSGPKPLWDQAQYAAAFNQVQKLISGGDIYQANLTFPLIATYSGSALGLYQQLRAKQPVPYGAFVNLGGATLLSRSPELFFRIDERGHIETKPMKGTAARGATAQHDSAQIAWLRNSEKNMSENLMIVDLLRNDMSKLAQVGSVNVPALFEVETYATLHQMTSHITAQLLPNVSLFDIFEALFPCGSITGAPKIRAMQVIRALEPQARDAYCGAIGWIAPDGSMQFNVAIRTVACDDVGGARLNVGGGIVHDSNAADEYAEAILKSCFAFS